MFDINLPSWYLPAAASLLVLLAAFLWLSRHRAEPDEDREVVEKYEPRHGVEDDDDTASWLLEMREPGVIAEPEPGTDEAWAEQFRRLDDQLEVMFRRFDADLSAKLGDAWDALVAEAARQLAEFRHRVDAVNESTAEWPVLDAAGAR